MPLGTTLLLWEKGEEKVAGMCMRPAGVYADKGIVKLEMVPQDGGGNPALFSSRMPNLASPG